VLQLSFRTVLLEQKKEITEVSNQKIKILERKVDKLYETVMNSEETNYDDIVALATSYCNMGIIYKNDTSQEKLLIGQNYLHKSLQLLKGEELDYRAVLIVMRVYIQMYNIFHKLDNPEFNQYLYKIIDLYLNYTKKDKFVEPVVIYSVRLDIEGQECSNTMVSLWTLYSSSLYDNQVIFHLQLQDNSNFIITMHNFLVDQWAVAAEKPLNIGLYWVRATTELAQYLFRNFRFTEARNSLAAAEYMLRTYCLKKLSKLPLQDTEYFNFYMNEYYIATQYNAILWGLYGNTILQSSINNLLYPQNFRQKRIYKIDESELVSSIMSKKSAKLLLFMNLEENLKKITNKITDTYVSNFHDASLVYNYSILHLTIVNIYYDPRMTMEIFPLFFVQYNISSMYKHFAFFELDRNKQMKLYRLQIKILQGIYDANEVPNDILRVASFELIIAYARLITMILKDEVLPDEVLPDEVLLDEIVKFSNNSIRCYAFLIFKIYEKLE
jgi:hypothetical protein